MIKGDLVQRMERAAREPDAVRDRDRRARREADERARRATPRSCSRTGRSRASSAASAPQASVRLHAARVLETGDAVLLRLLPGTPPGEGEPCVHDGVIVAHNPCLSGGSLEIFLEPQLAAPRVVVVGDTPIARALEAVARAAGYDVVRSDAGDVEPHASDAALIVASHGSDEEAALVARARGGRRLRGPRRQQQARRGRARLARRARGAARRDPHAGRARHRRAGADRRRDLDPRRAGGGADRAPAGAPAPAPVAPATAIDPVCGMEVAASDASIHLDAGGERVYFCCDGCRSTFAAQHAGDVAARWLSASPGSSSPPAARAGSGSRSSCCPTGTRRCSATSLAPPARARSTSWSACSAAAPDAVRDTRRPRRAPRSSRTRVRHRLLVVDRRRARRRRPALRRARAPARRPARRDAGDGGRAAGRPRRRRRSPPAATTTGAGTRSRSRAATFPELRSLHGDKGVWKLLDRRAGEVADVPVAGPVPLDVDTWEDYRRLRSASAGGLDVGLTRARRRRRGGRARRPRAARPRRRSRRRRGRRRRGRCRPSVAGSSEPVVRPSTGLPSSGSSSSSSRGASEPPSSAGTMPSAEVPAHSPFARASSSPGVVPPRCSLGLTPSSSVMERSSLLADPDRREGVPGGRSRNRRPSERAFRRVPVRGQRRDRVEPAADRDERGGLDRGRGGQHRLQDVQAEPAGGAVPAAGPDRPGHVDRPDPAAARHAAHGDRLPAGPAAADPDRPGEVVRVGRGDRRLGAGELDDAHPLQAGVEAERPLGHAAALEVDSAAT